MWILPGNLNERGVADTSAYISRGSRKSSLFFFWTAYRPEIGLSGARVLQLAELGTLLRVRCPQRLENPG